MRFEPRPPIFTTKYIIGLVLLVFVAPSILILSMVTYLSNHNKPTPAAVQQAAREKGTAAFMSVCKDGRLHIPSIDGSMTPVVNDRLEFMKC